MKACVLTDWKRLELKDIPVPALQEDEVLVEVLYGGVCGSDVTVFNHHHLTATIPRILCHEIFGRVSRINSTRKLPYREGDKVVVFPLIYCGKCKACLNGHTSACSSLQIRGLHVDGGFAEYIKADTASIIPVDPCLPDRIAALTEPFSIGYHANRIAETVPGDTVLVIGGGPIGLITAITSAYFSAKVLVSEPNAERRAMAEAFGFETLDPLTQDVPAEVMARTGGTGTDVVMEVSGTQAGFDAAVPAVSECGVIVPVAIPSEKRAIQTNLFILKEASMRGIRCCPLDQFQKTADMLADMYCRELYPLEKLIAKELPLSGVAEGIALQAEGKLNGKVLIDIREGL
jgi:threonine dehydrogenase-like Zn-dependent dehydrogenase